MKQLMKQMEAIALEPIHLVPDQDVNEFLDEFVDITSYCHPLWRMHENRALTADEVGKQAEADGEQIVALYVSQRLCGVFRITPKPKHIANGMVGFAIRPSMRGIGYGNVLVKFMSALCTLMLCGEVTAVVEANNHRSRITLESCGWRRTGNEYAWTNGKGVEYHLVR